MRSVGIYLECFLLVVCGFACLIFPEWVPDPVAQVTLSGTFAGRALGIALIGLAIPLLPIRETLWATSERLKLSFRLVPTAYLALLVVSWRGQERHGLRGFGGRERQFLPSWQSPRGSGPLRLGVGRHPSLGVPKKKVPRSTFRALGKTSK